MKLLLAISKRVLKAEPPVDFLVGLFNTLSGGHTVGLVTDGKAEQVMPGLTAGVKVYNRKAVVKGDWDVMVVPDALSQAFGEKIMGSMQVPVIFLSHAHRWPYLPLAGAGLLRVLACYTGPAGVPAAFSETVRKPVMLSPGIGLKSRPLAWGSGRQVKTLYVLEGADSDLACVRAILKAVNLCPFVRLTVVAPLEYHLMLGGVSNENISFVDDRKFRDDVFPDFDLFMGSGHRALTALYLAVPTILVGVCGLGGLISTKNIDAHIDWNFRGRIGGEVGEHIPLALLVDELVEFAKDPESIWGDMDAVTEKLRKQFSAEATFSDIEKKMDQYLSYVNRVVNEADAGLYPKLTRHVTIRDTDRSGAVEIVNGDGKVIGNAPAVGRRILNACREGEKSISEIALETSESVSEVRSFLHELWVERVIFFAFEKHPAT